MVNMANTYWLPEYAPQSVLKQEVSEVDDLPTPSPDAIAAAPQSDDTIMQREVKRQARRNPHKLNLPEIDGVDGARYSGHFVAQQTLRSAGLTLTLF
jgi:hypothetical protein